MRNHVDLLLVNPRDRLEQFAVLSDLATVAQPLGEDVLKFLDDTLDLFTVKL